MNNEKIQGVVERVNKKGLKIDGKWYNYSKWMKQTTTTEEGDEVIIEIEGDWIMKIDTLSHSSNGKATNSYAEKEKRETQRQIVITRLACLNTATEILKTHTKPVTSEDLFNVATKLEGWVWQGLTHDLNNDE